MSGLFAILMAIGCTGSPTGPQSTEGDITDNGPSPTEPGTPGHVTDLIVTDSTGTGVTLSFTQVDDGAGSPADYAIRTHVGPMNWGAADEVSQGTCAAPLQGTGIGSTIACTIEGLLPDVAYTFQVAAFRGTFQSGAVYGELSNVVPDMGDEADQSPNDGPGEPEGLTPIASVDFSDGINAQNGVCTEREGNTDYLSDNSAPTGDGRVFRGKFPSGGKDGVSYWRFDCWGPEHSSGAGEYQYDEVYVSFWLKIEGNDYQNQKVGTKLLYMSYGTADRYNDMYLMLRNETGGQAVQTQMTLAAHLSTQDDEGDTSAFLQSPNVTNRKVQVGDWTKIELRMKVNDIGASNGELDLWVNGTHTTRVRDWVYRSSISPRAFYHLQFTPVYGGSSGDVRTRDDYWRLDNLYVSGR